MYQSCLLDSQDVGISEPASGRLERGVTTRLRLVAPVADGITFRLCLTSGRIVIYASTIPNPSSAQYGWRDEVIATAHPLTCLTSYFDLYEEDGNKRKRRQISETATVSFYITLEGQDEQNAFSFDSRIGNVTLGIYESSCNVCLRMRVLSIIYMQISMSARKNDCGVIQMQNASTQMEAFIVSATSAILEMEQNALQVCHG